MLLMCDLKGAECALLKLIEYRVVSLVLEYCKKKVKNERVQRSLELGSLCKTVYAELLVHPNRKKEAANGRIVGISNIRKCKTRLAHGSC